MSQSLKNLFIDRYSCKSKSTEETNNRTNSQTKAPASGKKKSQDIYWTLQLEKRSESFLTLSTRQEDVCQLAFGAKVARIQSYLVLSIITCIYNEGARARYLVQDPLAVN